MRRIKPGDVVAITFDDHTEGEVGLLTFVVYGRVHVVADRYVAVDSWAHPEPDAPRDENVGGYTILRDAIRSIEVLQRSKKR